MKKVFGLEYVHSDGCYINESRADKFKKVFETLNDVLMYAESIGFTVDISEQGVELGKEQYEYCGEMQLDPYCHIVGAVEEKFEHESMYLIIVEKKRVT